MDRLPIEPKIQLGFVCATPGALSVLTALEITTALLRHQRGDWGDLSKEDIEENELSLREGFRILSAYPMAGDEKFWIITEADRTVTTVLLPSEY
ncbi:MAG TPA: hypothetical protein DCP71_14175 [Verrucomicrobiales bacterium]|nr:hypothetical protein [Verrucomicrobiales bacterium]